MLSLLSTYRAPHYKFRAPHYKLRAPHNKIPLVALYELIESERFSMGRPLIVTSGAPYTYFQYKPVYN